MERDLNCYYGLYLGLLIQTVGKRKLGRPKRRWSDCTKEDLNRAVGEDVQESAGWGKRVHIGDRAQDDSP